MKTWVVDSFTDKPFSGNPAGVCMPHPDTPDERLQLIARELQHSETAFIYEPDATGVYRIRYFSPLMEVPLCGHATLAAARVLFDTGLSGELCFRTTQDLELRVTAQSDGQLAMRFPRYALERAEASAELLAALGLDSVEEVWINPDLNILMVVITDPDVLADLRPDEKELLACPDELYGVLVTAPAANSAHDFHSRFFWPWSGGLEDPVTGGTHTFLGPYWADRLNRTSLRSWQSSARGGEMEVYLNGVDALTISGHATIVLRGELSGV